MYPAFWSLFIFELFYTFEIRSYHVIFWDICQHVSTWQLLFSSAFSFFSRSLFAYSPSFSARVQALFEIATLCRTMMDRSGTKLAWVASASRWSGREPRQQKSRTHCRGSMAPIISKIAANGSARFPGNLYNKYLPVPTDLAGAFSFSAILPAVFGAYVEDLWSKQPSSFAYFSFR